MGNNLLMRSFYREFVSECTEEFPDHASPGEKITFLKDHMICRWNGFEELMFVAWLDGLTPVEFLQAGRIAYEKRQANKRAETEKQD